MVFYKKISVPDSDSPVVEEPVLAGPLSSLLQLSLSLLSLESDSVVDSVVSPSKMEKFAFADLHLSMYVFS